MPISGKAAVKILERNGFIVSRQRGSHVVPTKQAAGNKNIVVVPLHKELKKGTLRSIARMAGLDTKELGL